MVEFSFWVFCHIYYTIFWGIPPYFIRIQPLFYVGSLRSLYENKGLNIKQFDKTYTVSFMNRNDKQAEHLIIMNYNEEIDMQEKLFA